MAEAKQQELAPHDMPLTMPAKAVRYDIFTHIGAAGDTIRILANIGAADFSPPPAKPQHIPHDLSARG